MKINFLLRLNKFHFWEIIKTEGFKKYTRNIGWLFFGQFVSMVIAFFVSARVAVYLGPADFGLMNYVFSFVGLFSFLGTLGIDSILVRELLKNSDQRDSLLGTSLFLKVIGSIFVVGVSGLAALALGVRENELTLIIIYSVIFLLQSVNVIALFFQAQVRSKDVVKIQIAVSVLSAIIKILFILYQLPLLYFVISYLIDAVNTGVCLLVVYSFKVSNLKKWSFHLSIAISILKDSWWLMLSGLMILIYMRLDQVIVKLLLGNISVGYYAAAVKLAEIFYFIPSMLYAAIFPAIVNAHSADSGKFNGRLAMFYGAMFWLSIFLALPLFLFSNKIILLIFGADFLPSVPTMKIYVWAMLPIFLGNVFSSYMVTRNFVKGMFFWNVAGAAANVILNLLLIPRIGILGAAWATVISYLLTFIGMLLGTKENRKQVKFILSGIFLFPFIKKEGNEIF